MQHPTGALDLQLTPAGDVRCEFGGWATPRPTSPVDRHVLRWLWDRAQGFALFVDTLEIDDPPSEQRPLGRKRRQLMQGWLESAQRLTATPAFYRAVHTPACEAERPLMLVDRCTPDVGERILAHWAPSLVWPAYDGWEDLVLFDDAHLIYWSVSHEGRGAYFCQPHEVPRAGPALDVSAAPTTPYRLTGVPLDLRAWVESVG